MLICTDGLTVQKWIDIEQFSISDAHVEVLLLYHLMELLESRYNSNPYYFSYEAHRLLIVSFSNQEA